MLVAGIINEVIHGADIMDAHGFIVNLRENFMKVGQDKISLYIDEM